MDKFCSFSSIAWPWSYSYNFISLFIWLFVCKSGCSSVSRLALPVHNIWSIQNTVLISMCTLCVKNSSASINVDHLVTMTLTSQAEWPAKRRAASQSHRLHIVKRLTVIIIFYEVFCCCIFHEMTESTKDVSQSGFEWRLRGCNRFWRYNDSHGKMQTGYVTSCNIWDSGLRWKLFC